MLISNGSTLVGGNEFSSVPGLTGCCPVPAAPARPAVINWKMDPVGLPAPHTAPSVLTAGIALSPSGLLSSRKYFTFYHSFEYL